MEIAFKIYSPHISSENIELLNSTGIKNISDSIYALSYLQNNARYLLFVISVSSTKINPLPLNPTSRSILSSGCITWNCNTLLEYA